MNTPDTHKLNAKEKLDWLRLARSDNVGPITFYKLLERFGDAGAAIDALPELARHGGRAKRLRVCTRADAEKEMETLDGIGARLIARILAGDPDVDCFWVLVAHQG